MSSSETTPSAPVNDPTVEAQASSVQPTTESVPDDKSTTQPAKEPTPAETLGETPATDPIPSAEPKPVEATKPDEEKKDKKHGRKPFAELLNKILKPHPHASNEKSGVAEKKVEPEATTSAPANDEAEPTSPAVAPETTNEAPAADVSLAEPVQETTPIDEPQKEGTTPRKERGNILEKITAFVLKPKSPKAKKSEVTKDEVETKPQSPSAEVATDAPADLTTPAATEAPATEATVTTPAAETSAPAPTTEVTEEPKHEKKEKTPKDLAKLARRFSGRIFGSDKKKETAKKPTEPTAEEIEETPAGEATNAPIAVSSSPPQIPAEVAQTSESSKPTNESTPVIAAAA